MNKMEIGGVFLTELPISNFSYCILNDIRRGHYFGNKQRRELLVVRLAVF